MNLFSVLTLQAPAGSGADDVLGGGVPTIPAPAAAPHHEPPTHHLLPTIADRMSG